MPNFDGTDPKGMGSINRKGLWPCGLGLGCCRKFGAGCRMRRCLSNWSNSVSKEEKAQALSDYKKALEEELEGVKKEEEELK